MVYCCPTWLTLVSPFRPSLEDSGTLVPYTRTMIGCRDCRVGHGNMNSVPIKLQTSTLSTVTFIKRFKRLLAPLRTLSKCINAFIHSFIQPYVVLQLTGVVRVIMKPLVNRIPIVAGVTVYFLKQPVSSTETVYWQ